MIKYRINNTPEVQHITSYSEEYIKDLTKEELESLRNYTLSTYRNINSSLRNDNTPKESIYIDSALDKFFYARPITVFRKLCLSKNALLHLYNDLQFKGFLIDKAYQSTSLNKVTFDEIANAFIEINITNPYCGAYIAPISEIPMEQEFLIKRCTPIDIEFLSYDERLEMLLIRGRIK